MTTQTEVQELILYIENDYGTSKAYYFPTLAMIQKHYDKGRGDYEKGIKALARYAVLPSAKQYLLEHGSMIDSVRSVFPPAIREMVATELMDRFLAEYRAGNLFWA